MYKLILASQSPRRKDLLQKAGFSFDIEPSNFEEDMTQRLTPSNLVKDLSYGKARDVADKHRGETCIILGGDSIVAFDGKIFGKPKNKADAFKTLSLFSGKEHQVLTGITLINAKTGKTKSFSLKLKVWFRDISSKEIHKYIDSGEPMDKGGSYAIQENGKDFIVKTEGDVTCAIGLPIEETTKQLKLFGITSETK